MIFESSHLYVTNIFMKGNTTAGAVLQKAFVWKIHQTSVKIIKNIILKATNRN